MRAGGAVLWGGGGRGERLRGGVEGVQDSRTGPSIESDPAAELSRLGSGMVGLGHSICGVFAVDFYLPMSWDVVSLVLLRQAL